MASSVTAEGCAHYRRGCQKYCQQCAAYFPCRVCHDEQVFKHQFDRFNTPKIRCNTCLTEQPFSGTCISCGRSFGSYVCFKCKLVSDNGQPVYHCDKCGICRIGVQSMFTHCDKCNVCISGAHKCIPDSLEAACPVCREYMFDSRQEVVLMRCGHPIHHVCLNELSQHNFRCPLCLKAIGDMSSINSAIETHMQVPLNPDALGPHANSVNIILCNECEKRSEAPFHYSFHKCQYCQGYNTTVISTRKLS